MKITAIGADISINDVYCSHSLTKNIQKDIPRLVDVGAHSAALTNITGDDVVVSAFVEDNLLEKVNQEIVSILKDHAEDIGDLNGISNDQELAGEGISYAEASIRQDRYLDAVIIAFDTYGGEASIGNVSNSCIDAATNINGLIDVSDKISHDKKIPGVGYVSNETDDPVIVATVENIDTVGVIAGAMIGAACGNKNTYLVERGTPCNVIPGSVIFSATAFMNGNVIDLAVPFQERSRILR